MLLGICCAPSVASGQIVEVTLTATDHNGYNISCFGLKDGAIDATVTGGTLPYEFHWSTKDSTEDVTGLPAGYYELRVMDADSVWGVADITLTEPRGMKIGMEPYQYPGSYNVSCYDCYNGSINVTVYGGEQPYTYLWNDNVQTEDRSALGALKYRVKVTDDNGCETFSETIYLTQPDRNDWQMSGNVGTDAETQYIGTADSQDVVLKSNATERLRLMSDGGISLLGHTAIGKGFLYLDEHGILKGGPYPYAIPVLAGPCFETNQIPFWETRGNTFPEPLCDEPLLGTMSDHALRMVTNGHQRMIISTTGLVGIAGVPATDQLEVNTSLPNSGISLINSSSAATARTVVRFKKGVTDRWELGCDLHQDGGNNFFLWDAVEGTSRIVVDEEGKVGIGTTPPVASGYKLFVEGGIATRDVMVKLDDWPDYVFEEGYHLLSLAELKDYLGANGHLPGIPSAAEVDKQGGVEVGDLQKRMLETIEQQALYILQLEERMKTMEQRVVHLEAAK